MQARAASIAGPVPTMFTDEKSLEYLRRKRAVTGMARGEQAVPCDMSTSTGKKTSACVAGDDDGGSLTRAEEDGERGEEEEEEEEAGASGADDDASWSRRGDWRCCWAAADEDRAHSSYEWQASRRRRAESRRSDRAPIAWLVTASDPKPATLTCSALGAPARDDDDEEEDDEEDEEEDDEEAFKRISFSKRDFHEALSMAVSSLSLREEAALATGAVARLSSTPPCLPGSKLSCQRVSIHHEHCPCLSLKFRCPFRLSAPGSSKGDVARAERADPAACLA